jgi:hypothetical protein
MSFMKLKIQERIKQKIKEDPSMGTDTLEDHNNINEIMIIGNIFATLKLVILISNLTYFVALFWITYCDIVEESFTHWSIREIGEDEFFLKYVGINDLYLTHDIGTANYLSALYACYFTFTSLSTVGFGDMHPRNEAERFLCAFILLLGVAIFSYIMGIFIEILANFQLISQELGAKDDKLSTFLNVIKMFNGNQSLDK